VQDVDNLCLWRSEEKTPVEKVVYKKGRCDEKYGLVNMVRFVLFICAPYQQNGTVYRQDMLTLVLSYW
jgi:hypothetical protein